MKILKTVLLVATLVTIAACGSAERKKNKADAERTKEETKTMQEYKACVKKANSDEDKLDACERILKANQ